MNFSFDPDVELAEGLSAEWVTRAGRKESWLLALAEGEHWAAKFCRLIASLRE